MEDLISVTEAASRSGLSRVYIRKLVREGRVEGRRIGHIWVVVADSLNDFLKSERKIGRRPIDK